MSTIQAVQALEACLVVPHRSPPSSNEMDGVHENLEHLWKYGYFLSSLSFRAHHRQCDSLLLIASSFRIDSHPT